MTSSSTRLPVAATVALSAIPKSSENTMMGIMAAVDIAATTFVETKPRTVSRQPVDSAAEACRAGSTCPA